jgi:hypothetical protein
VAALKDGSELAGELFGVFAIRNALLASDSVRSATVAVDGARKPELVAGRLVLAGHSVARIILREPQTHHPMDQALENKDNCLLDHRQKFRLCSPYPANYQLSKKYKNLLNLTAQDQQVR